MLMDELRRLVEACGEDADDYMYTNGSQYIITFNDFVGFDENWNEISRDYENPEAINTVFNFLEANAVDLHTTFFRDFMLENCLVRITYASYDI